ncbi:MAG: pirin family protein [Bacteriovorax sp.]|nr:pirin family protein [Bacteriovorax sp.]
MLVLRKSEERGFADHGWLKSYHSFSFAHYFNAQHMGFKNLRVINEDRIASGKGFDSHPHKDMEIISYVITGTLEHKDSLGTRSIIRPGEIQRMSAGSGVIHSEYNAQIESETHFFQIWIIPNQKGLQPGYDQKSFENDLNTKKLVLVVSEEARDNSIGIKQDADMYISRLKKMDTIHFSVRPNRGAWIQLIKGSININNQNLVAGDAASTMDAQELSIFANEESEFILFDLA